MPPPKEFDCADADALDPLNPPLKGPKLPPALNDCACDAELDDDPPTI